MAACRLPALPLQASPFVQATFVRAPFVHEGEHKAPIADLLVGGSICARVGEAMFGIVDLTSGQFLCNKREYMSTFFWWHLL